MEEKLKSACVKLQVILERKSQDIADAGYRCFRDFPNGFCHATTHFLAHYLIAQDLCYPKDIRMPWNNYDDKDEWSGASHGWVMLRNGLNLDITAYQFSGIKDKVIVSRDHEVHRRFVGGELVSFDEHHRRLMCESDKESFKDAWSIITKEA